MQIVGQLKCFDSHRYEYCYLKGETIFEGEVIIMKRIMVCLFVLVFFHIGITQAKDTVPLNYVHSKCMRCHAKFKDMKDIVAGNFYSRSNKARSITVNTGKQMMVIKFTQDTQIVNAPNIKALKKPVPVRVHFKRIGPDLVASKVVVKPKMKVPKDQLMETKELEKLISLGPEKGKYTLVDARPSIKYEAGHIPTAISIPFPKMKKLKDRLPRDKSRLLIFYCEGFR